MMLSVWRRHYLLMTFDFGRLFVVVIVCLSLDSFLLTCLLDVVLGYVVVEVQLVSLFVKLGARSSLSFILLQWG